MKKITDNNKLHYELTDAECEQMLQLAETTLANTFPTSGSGYAAVVMNADGKLYEGASYGSDTYTLTMHGEMVALAHAATHGAREIVAITGPNCHICKQLIYESSLRSGIDIVVVMKEESGFKQVPISTIMPYPWPAEPFLK
ncbi:MAG: hypothetical protein ACEQSA_03240 [Weeksellaceae bacterium]